ncbi:MAG TPA: c-type cytochrome [Chloroflexota bacterium]|nr:c-type cytochrome [Chloroflexota bacterium]
MQTPVVQAAPTIPVSPQASPSALSTLPGASATTPSLAQPSPALAGSPAPSGSPAASTAPGQPAAGTAPPPDLTAVSEGQALIAQKGCGGCHIIPGIAGATGTVGPDLTGVASRTTIAGGAVPNTGPDDLKRWIMNPPALKPGTQMPNLGLTDEEATRIVAYLETLK